MGDFSVLERGSFGGWVGGIGQRMMWLAGRIRRLAGRRGNRWRVGRSFCGRAVRLMILHGLIS